MVRSIVPGSLISFGCDTPIWSEPIVRPVYSSSNLSYKRLPYNGDFYRVATIALSVENGKGIDTVLVIVNDICGWINASRVEVIVQ